MTNAHRLALMLILGSLLACRSDEPLAPPRAVPFTPSTKGSVQVLIERSPQLRGDTVLFIVRVIGEGLPLAAYQGTVTFSTAAMDALAVKAPDTQDGEYRVVNDRELAAGRIRFAAFAPQAFSSTEAFRIFARLKQGALATNLVGTLEVAGNTAGAAVRPQLLLRSDGVHNVIANPAPAR